MAPAGKKVTATICAQHPLGRSGKWWLSPFSPRVLLHADDFGLHRTATDGIVRGFAEGLLTSTSILANAPDAARSLDAWRRLEERRQRGDLPSLAARRRLDDPPLPFDLGVHLNLTQGRPMIGEQYPAALLDAEGRFPGAGGLFRRLWRHGARARDAIQAELRRQVQFVLDHGARPTHLNGHQYIEMMPVVADVTIELLAEFGIPAVRVAREPRLWRSTLAAGRVPQWLMGHIKHFFAQRFQRRLPAAIARPDAFFGTVHAGRIDMHVLRRFLDGPPPGRLVEVALHPAESAEVSAAEAADGWTDPLAACRGRELTLLLSGELAEYLETHGWRLGRLGSPLPPCGRGAGGEGSKNHNMP